ncbi:transposon-encoded TnpW family protein [Streptococcus oralis]|uniref:transposon-encoded TnpW family protein n=1 Tax=Streptococcus oralis TaxID=1303 RepID=UPI00280A7E8F|nr:transposon-encoded TnpW family protein [uncultured Streptococcus sp.]
MEELKNTGKKGISTKRKIGKTTYEVVVHFNENATETMQDKLTRIMLRELRRKSDEKKDDFD